MHAGRILQSGVPRELVESREVKEIYLGESFSFSADGMRPDEV
jgi:ABC-type lipopolysaccharide export system ATPase subunit